MHLAELSAEDLRRLREVVMRVHMKYHPQELQTEREADMIIESLLPATVERLLKREIDGKR